MKRKLSIIFVICLLHQATLIELHSQQLQWKNLGYPSSSRTQYQGSTLDSSGNVYVAMEYGGIFRGTDYDSLSQYWTSSWTHTLFAPGYIFELFSDPDGFTYAGVEGVGVARTSNGGRTWENKSLGLPVYPSFCAFGLVNANTIIVGTYPPKLFSSTDHGEHWSPLPGLDSIVNAPKVIYQAKSGDVLLGTMGDGLFRSKDGCTTWQRIPFFSKSSRITSISSLPDGTLIAAAEFDGVYLSEDNGNSWHDILHSRFGFFISVAGYSDNTIICADAVGDVCISKNRGLSWDSLGIFNCAIRSMVCSPKGNLYVFTGGDFASVYRIENLFRAPLLIPNLSVISMASKDSMLVVGAESGASLLSLYNNDYQQLSFSANPVHEILFSRDNSIYLGYLGNRLVRVYRDGMFYMSSDIPTPVAGGYSCFALAEDHNGVIFAGTGGDFLSDTIGSVFTSYDKGVTWQNYDSNLPLGTVHKLLVTKSNTLLASVFHRGLFRIENRETAWNPVTGFQPPGDGIAESFAQDSSGSIYCGTESNGIYCSNDDGKSWLQLPGSRSLDRVTDLLVLPDGSLLATTKGGVYTSGNKGQTWDEQNLGLSSLFAWAATIDRSGYVYIGTYGAGIFKSQSSLTSINSEKRISFAPCRLYQNYPNPFNPNTTIPFTLPYAAQVTIKIFDELGRQVDVLISEKLPAGKHECHWNASRFTTGVYFCQLQIASHIETRKLLLIK